ncbi:S8 family serine peptidase [Streptomyces sp. ISL-99]|uniref:S8 family serine peptidase n=1 Tax=Streptomyces sp. ISL-99 TaxID=2819193 RepID=UPI001BEC3E64|nr:S8 family serine peptidase [Streptomyces sp. ISL-99]MBT2526201.1 S8 family serine peptidase [Streptomyces sp. ISL-99]
MDRDDLETAFYGEGRFPIPWATDCPVRFDAWLALTQPSPPGPEHREDLILAINEEHGVQRVLQHFRELGMTDCQPVAAGSFVAARLTLGEVVQAVLPMTNLLSLIRLAKELAGQVGPEGVEAALLGHYKSPPTSDVHDNIERRQERSRHLMWFLGLLRTVIAASQPDLRRTPADEPALDEPALIGAMTSMLKDVALESPLTRPADAPSRGVIDRRKRHPITSVTTNRQAAPAVVRSRSTIKADAAEQVFSVDCGSIGWAIVDSGIDARHPAFYDWDTASTPAEQLASRVIRAFNFVGVRGTLSADALENGLIDWSRALPYVEMELPAPQNRATRTDVPYTTPGDPHGTHIAGILGASWPDRRFRGICPTIRLYDFRVLDDKGEGDEFSIVTALQAVRHINEQAGRFVIAGVNISLSVPHDVATHSTGWTPVCIECDHLARSGVVVVAAAGNAGFSGAMRTLGADYRSISISDPGNAESVITVGSTHRSNPHRHGVSYFSSRGPTGDGRPKPDLLAPGEDIDGPIPGAGISAMHGTSQAAAHVSGAAAMLLARNRELLGRPERVKQVLCSTATDLARERDFQGHGLVDVLRAMQSV